MLYNILFCIKITGVLKKLLLFQKSILFHYILELLFNNFSTGKTRRIFS